MSDGTDAGRAALAALAATAPQQRAPRLDEATLARHLALLPQWAHDADAIAKEFRFASYAETIGFVNALAWIAQRLDHHPDLEVGYTRCRVVWTTHDAGGVTLNDCIAAAKTEQLLQ